MSICAIDVGGTGSRIRIDGGAGRRIEFAGPGIHVAAGGPDIAGLVAALRQPVRDALDRLALRAVDAAAVGQSGLLMLGRRSPDVHAGLARITGARVTVVASDALTSLVGAVGYRPGAVVAAGTGCIGFGTDLASVWNRVDGWGHVLGDEGGGSWIGKKGLQAALRAHDGRPDGSPELRRCMLERFGPPDALTSALYSATDRAGMLAAFATDTADAARAGDDAARRIWAEAGVRLARCAAAALNGGVAPIVAFTGGITGSSDLYADALAGELSERRPDADVVDAAGSALDGAAALAERSAERPDDPVEHAPYVTTFRRQA
ncbi:N-acetylglucosamine kinase [Spelaeicoccus albus]|uniref:N-acetylglucosamine kinase-like BadF-type ATPase n=1 Tax=Spelaeicoccus albus TaxID=1280376 RepID=A0A7Z0AAA6_9MICO|nr:BadF/BadG/BcrA/BcrD ATPase family protein [Spelaeicoccus albus]NYI67324.1 N-acetylglucosamine kinase-like BadF-type ATPase [Spelaeicoccus albus]